MKKIRVVITLISVSIMLLVFRIYGMSNHDSRYKNKKDLPVVSTLVTTPSINANEDIIVDSNGKIYVCGGWRSPNSLYKIESESNVKELLNIMSTALSITEDNKGNMYVTDKEKLIKISTNGNIDTLVNQRVGGGIIADKKGDLYTIDFYNQMMKKISQQGKVETFITSSLFNGPTGIAYNDDKDEIYVGNWNDGKILLVNKNGNVSEIIDTTGEIGRMTFGNNHIYVTSNSEHLIYEISLNGTITKTIGNGNKGETDGDAFMATFSNPNGIGISPDGNVLYVSSREGGIRKIEL